MKKVFLTITMVLGILQISNAQIDFGIKAGINYNSDNFQNVKDDVLSGAKSRAGYHAGIWFRGTLGGIFIRPELIYTELNSEVNYKPIHLQILSSLPTSKGTNTNFKLKKIDVPVLIGTRFFRVINAFVGPSFQYIINSEFDIVELKESNIGKKVSVGLQAGIGVEFGKFGLDLRWERSFSDSEMEFLRNNVSTEEAKLKFDHRMNQVIVSLSYQF